MDDSYPADINWLAFIEYALEGFRDGLITQHEEICALTTGVIWHDFVHRAFPKKLTDSQQRRKQLALDFIDLSPAEPASGQEIRNLSPAMAAAYAGRSDRMITRDLNALVEMNLLKSVGGGRYVSNTDLLFTFFAKVRPDED